MSNARRSSANTLNGEIENVFRLAAASKNLVQLLNGMCFALMQFLDLLMRYKHQASPSEQQNASRSFSSFCTVVQKHGPPKAKVPFKSSAQASNELQKLLEELQPEVRATASFKSSM